MWKLVTGRWKYKCAGDHSDYFLRRIKSCLLPEGCHDLCCYPCSIVHKSSGEGWSRGAQPFRLIMRHYSVFEPRLWAASCQSLGWHGFFWRGEPNEAHLRLDCSHFEQFWVLQTQLHGLLVQNLFCARTWVPKGVITSETAAVLEQDFQYPSYLRCPYCL